MPNFIKDLLSGWDLTIKKLSTKIAAVELTALIPVLGTMVASGQMDAMTVLIILGSVSVLKLIASNVTQTSIGTYSKETQGVYDLSKFVLTPKDEVQ